MRVVVMLLIFQMFNKMLLISLYLALMRSTIFVFFLQNRELEPHQPFYSEQP